MAAFALDDVVKSAVQVGRGTPRSGKADARVMLSAVTDGNLVYPVTLLVEQIQDGSMEVVGAEALPGIDRQRLYSYSVKRGIKTEPAVSRTDAAETSSLTSTGSGISIAKLYEAVKGDLAKTVEGFREDEKRAAQGEVFTRLQLPFSPSQGGSSDSSIAQSQTAVNNSVSEDGGNDAGNIQADRQTPGSPQPGQPSFPGQDQRNIGFRFPHVDGDLLAAQMSLIVNESPHTHPYGFLLLFHRSTSSQLILS